MMNNILYRFFLKLFVPGAWIRSIWDPKARLWLAGRKDIFGRIGEITGKSIWIHCASLGEYEQGRPLIEDIRLVYPGFRIIVSFFSPSGFEVMKDKPGDLTVIYLPVDSPKNAKRVIDAINPSLVIWVKYEFWYYFLHELKDREIPVILVSGIFRKGQAFFRRYGGLWRKMLDCFTHFFVQDRNSVTLLAGLGFRDNVTLNGDTRFDRVLSIASDFEPLPLIRDFCKENKVIVAGSTWEEDELELMHYVNTRPEIRFIIAPHEIDRNKLDSLKKQLPGSLFYSELAAALSANQELPHVLIMDNMGMLSRLYRYATIAYVGGGFGTAGVHNVLEPAVYGRPVAFGPEYAKYIEAAGLIEAGGAISADQLLGLEYILDDLLTDEPKRNAMGLASEKYVANHQGATGRIIAYIQEKRLLTS